MARYSCSREGVIALRELASSVENSIIYLTDIINSTKLVLEPYSQDLGAHYDCILGAMSNITARLTESTNSAEEVRRAILEVAEIYEAVIARTPNYVDDDIGSSYEIGSFSK